MATQELPDLIQLAAEEKRRRLIIREFELTRDIREYFDALTPELERELQDYFLTFFILGQPLDPATTPTWDLVRATQLGTIDQLLADFDALVTEIEAVVEPDLDEGLTDAYEEGYLMGLWDLTLGGVDPDDLPEAPDDHDLILPLILAAGVAGQAHDQRMLAWGDVYTKKFEQWIRASVTGGRTLADTLDGVKTITSAYAGRLEGLGGDELHRAFSLGSSAAWGSVPNAVRGEMWLTREDPLVCPLCAAKNRTITTDQPVIHSHPSCRCIKAPILLHAVTGEPMDYAAFLRRIGKR